MEQRREKTRSVGQCTLICGIQGLGDSLGLSAGIGSHFFVQLYWSVPNECLQVLKARMIEYVGGKRIGGDDLYTLMGVG